MFDLRAGIASIIFPTLKNICAKSDHVSVSLQDYDLAGLGLSSELQGPLTRLELYSEKCAKCMSYILTKTKC